MDDSNSSSENAAPNVTKDYDDDDDDDDDDHVFTSCSNPHLPLSPSLVFHYFL